MAGFNVYDFLKDNQKMEQFQDFHWEGSFDEYIELVKKNPKITRNAFQRCFDMVKPRSQPQDYYRLVDIFSTTCWNFVWFLHLKREPKGWTTRKAAEYAMLLS